MVLASMCGSSASNGYGNGGTVNATGFSSGFGFNFGVDPIGVSSGPECSLGTVAKLAPTRREKAALAPTNPAPAKPVPINLRRFIGRFTVLDRWMRGEL